MRIKHRTSHSFLALMLLICLAASFSSHAEIPANAIRIVVHDSSNLNGPEDDGVCTLVEAVETMRVSRGADCLLGNPNPASAFLLVLPIDAIFEFQEPFYESEVYGKSALHFQATTVYIQARGATFVRSSDVPFRLMLATHGSELHVENLTLQNGWAEGPSLVQSSGGGLFAHQAQLTLSDLRFIENFAAGSGGGMFSIQGTTLLHESIFEDNTAMESGGGLFAQRTVTRLEHSVLDGNVAMDFGGAIAVTGDGSETINNGKAFDASHRIAFGRKSAHHGFLTLQHTLVKNNQANRGGGVYVKDSGVEIRESSLLNNVAEYEGSAGFLNSDDPKNLIAHTTIHGNSSPQGSAIFVPSESKLTIGYSTITENLPSSIIAETPRLAILASIIANDFSDTAQCQLTFENQVDLSFTLIQDGSCGLGGETTTIAAPNLTAPEGDMGLRYPTLAEESWIALHNHPVIDTVPCRIQSGDSPNFLERIYLFKNPLTMPYGQIGKSCDRGATEYWGITPIYVTNSEGLDIQEGDGCTLTEALMNATNQADFSDCRSGRPKARDIVIAGEVNLSAESIQILANSPAFQIPEDEPLTLIGGTIQRPDCTNFIGFIGPSHPPCFWDRYPPLLTVHSTEPTIIQQWHSPMTGPFSVIAAPGSTVYLYDITQGSGNHPRSTHPLVYANLAHVRVSGSKIDGIGHQFYDDRPGTSPYSLGVAPQFIYGHLIHAVNSQVDVVGNTFEHAYFYGRRRHFLTPLREYIYADNSQLTFLQNTMCDLYGGTAKNYLIRATGKSQVVVRENRSFQLPPPYIPYEPAFSRPDQCDNAACLILEDENEVVTGDDAWNEWSIACYP